ncbi:hypothetical protein NDU88_006685 [Pleurodeles waltl]|uniref:Uncharacterized protein n=1 Tax=Pleurodeles waltl TaxID=8319 RepID=A0AAV7SQM3_PLEWA|nr:hypothetical protein NDU88_006685 [Pleurodeles waltl]
MQSSEHKSLESLLPASDLVGSESKHVTIFDPNTEEDLGIVRKEQEMSRNDLIGEENDTKVDLFQAKYPKAPVSESPELLTEKHKSLESLLPASDLVGSESNHVTIFDPNTEEDLGIVRKEQVL